MKHSFGSDNHSGVHPLIMDAIVKENVNFKTAYGDDPYTKQVLGKLENLLGGNCTAVFVVNGTGANVVALSSFLSSYQCVLAPETAHINVDECGAPEKFSGSKIVTLPSPDGKVTAATVEKALINFGDQHHAQPRILSISQPQVFIIRCLNAFFSFLILYAFTLLIILILNNGSAVYFSFW